MESLFVVVCMLCVHARVYSVHAHVLEYNVGVEFYCKSLCEINVGQRLMYELAGGLVSGVFHEPQSVVSDVQATCTSNPALVMLI